MQFERKRNRLEAEKYFGRGRFFVTTCCRGRRTIFKHVETATAIVECLRDQSDRCGFDVHAYCVMPDHVHFLAEGKTDASDLIRFVKAFKQATGFACRERVQGPLWEKSFYDHILRSRDSDEDVAWYIWMNPVRKALCTNPAEFSYSGSFTMKWLDQTPPQHPWHPPQPLIL